MAFTSHSCLYHQEHLKRGATVWSPSHCIDRESAQRLWELGGLLLEARGPLRLKLIRREQKPLRRPADLRFAASRMNEPADDIVLSDNKFRYLRSN